MSKTFFISGHIDLTEEEYNAHYDRRVRKSNAQFNDCEYVVGGQSGCDELARKHLRQIGVSPARIWVYHKVDRVPDNPLKCKTKSFPTLGKMYEAMTYASTNDIAWVRPGFEDSAVQRNLKRRRDIYIARYGK